MYHKRASSLISVCPTVQYGLLHTKDLEREKILALRKCNEDYSATMLLPPHLQEDLAWWLNIFSNSRQSNIFLSTNFIQEIFSDASLNGCATSCG